MRKVCPVESYRLEVLTDPVAALMSIHYQADPTAELTWSPLFVLRADELRQMAARMLEIAQQLDAVALTKPTLHRH